mgnify:CR=1 FL=1|jgi:hypothetical protein
MMTTGIHLFDILVTNEFLIVGSVMDVKHDTKDD